VLLDPDMPALGHVPRQQWQERDERVTSTVQAYDAIAEEQIWPRIQALVASNARTKAVTRSRRTHAGVRRSDSSRHPLAGLVVCDACGKRLQDNTVRGCSLYRCRASSD
jgi:ribosomal protein L32